MPLNSSLFLAKLIFYSHLLFVAGMLLTPFFASYRYLRYYFIFLLLIVLQWRLLQNRCILTIFENKLLGATERDGVVPGFVERLGRLIQRHCPALRLDWFIKYAQLIFLPSLSVGGWRLIQFTRAKTNVSSDRPIRNRPQDSQR